jgi:mono/diheme cytochrome c family protein
MVAFADPALRVELVAAVCAAVAGVALVAVGAAWRLARWPALGLAVAIEVMAIPYLDLLFVTAYPTSYFASPTEFAATAIVSGGRLYATHCAACHGAEAQGNGPAAPSLPVAPADLTADHFRAHPDGDLYWFIARGFATADGKTAMPGFAGAISSDAIWYLIDYLRALNAGETLRRTGTWPQPLPMPQFDAQCADGRIVDLDDLRGHPLRLVAVSDEESPVPSLPAELGATTILVAHRAGIKPDGGACLANERQLWTALAILLGVSPNELAGTQVLVDGDALLREAWRPGDPGDWTDPGIVAARLRDVSAHPLAIGAPGEHAHQH